MPNFKLTLCYDGSRYRGWQKQGNTDNTIQAKTEKALGAILAQEIELNGSGRTDAGVHAKAQVASFRAKTDLGCEEILARLRAALPEDIGAVSLEEAPPRFHARLTCKRKTYVYRVWNSNSPNVFERRYLYFYPEKLDLAAMQEAARALTGEHDWLAFCSNRRMKKSSVRKVEQIKLERLGDEVRFTLTGDGFLYNMVRIIVGTLLEVGTHSRSADSMGEILASRVRENAGFTAPACGLYLDSVEY